MASPVHPPRGMRDFLPADKARRERALGIIRDVYRSHGFDEIETPVLEDWSRLHAGLGGDNEKLSFSILKRGLRQEAIEAAAAEGNADSLADLGLRFDLTVPLARFYASHRAELPPVFRALQIAPVWRAERPQKGRFRQFVQADIDIIGEAGVIAEVELITATSHALAALGLDGCVIRVNDRRVLFALLEHIGVPAALHDRALITLDKLDKIGADGVVSELAELVPESASALRTVLARMEEALAQRIPLTRDAIAAALPGVVAEAGIANLADLGSAISGNLPDGVSVGFDPTLVRGMGYYTGTIFEIAHPGSGSSVGGGGRYDGMVGRFLGQDVPAVGFSIGFERVVDLIDASHEGASNAVALVYDDSALYETLIGLKRDLVAEGHRVRLERRQKNMKTLFARLSGEGFGRFSSVNADVRSIADLVWHDLGE